MDKIDVRELVSRYETWLDKNQPALLAELNIPASNDQIDKLEALTGGKLPDSYSRFLKLHNGQKPESQALVIDGNEEWLSTERTAEEWLIWKSLLDSGEFEGNPSDPETGIKNDWWNPRWIPITSNHAGDHICIDLDPAPGGKYGQVITMFHDSGERKLLANSFGEWFSGFVDNLEKTGIQDPRL